MGGKYGEFRAIYISAPRNGLQADVAQCAAIMAMEEAKHARITGAIPLSKTKSSLCNGFLNALHNTWDLWL